MSRQPDWLSHFFHTPLTANPTRSDELVLEGQDELVGVGILEPRVDAQVVSCR